MTLPALGPRPSFTDPQADQDFALRLVRMLARDPDPQLAIVTTFIGAPIPKGRPRHTRQGITYTPKRTVQAERHLSVWLQVAVGVRPMVGPLALAVVFFQADHRRNDADNLLKLVMDSATKAGVWQDDSQVVAHAALVDLDAERPRTVIAIAPARTGLRRLRRKET